MVGVRIFLIVSIAFLLFNVSAYAILPSSAKKVPITQSEEEVEVIPDEIKEEKQRIKKEKERLIEDIAPLREERTKTLKPFVYPVKKDTSDTFQGFASDDADTELVRYRVKAVTPVAESGTEYSSARPAKQGVTSRLIPNFIFFSVIIIAFLASYFFIRPKSK